MLTAATQGAYLGGYAGTQIAAQSPASGLALAALIIVLVAYTFHRMWRG